MLKLNFVPTLPRYLGAMYKVMALLILTSLVNQVFGQTIDVFGVARNIHGESLGFAQVFVSPDSVSQLCNEEGKFNVKVKKGLKKFTISFIGYAKLQLSFRVSRDTNIYFILKEKSNELAVIEIEGVRNRQADLFKSNQTSTNIIDKEDINSIPVLGGEADVIKTLQLLPGSLKGVEGSADIFVRGGAADQNLVLLDGAPIYNTSHLFGFMSVFNPDILNNVESINGGFPARFGGRLSSILNVNTTSEIPERTNLSGDIGLIASRIMIEQPIVKEKASFWIAGRRTYIDKVVQALGEELPYFFYDLNGKFIWSPEEKNHFEFAYYGGEDILDWFRDRNNDGDGFLTTFESGNNSQSLLWKRKISKNWNGNLSLIRSKFKYDIRNIFEDNSLLARSDIEDYNVKALFSNDSVSNKVSLKTGLEWTRHTISPNVINTSGLFSEILASSSSKARIADEFSAHVETGFSPIKNINITTGFRGSMGMVKNKIYFNPEPRLSARISLPHDQALKLSYSRMVQYIHRISNSAVSFATDIWYPVTDSIRPQRSHQVAVAWQKIIPDDKLFFSVEGYYKSMSDLIGFEQGTNLFFNTEFEKQLIQGSGKAYGVEFLLRKEAGKLTGWLSYTLSWSWRRFDEINFGNWFPARYDRRHNGAVVMQYAFSKRLSTSLVWEYISGSRFTPIIGQYLVLAPTLTGADLIPVYSGVNQVTLSDTHRLDLGVKFRSKPGKKFQWHWFAGVYNVYNRAMPLGITISQDEKDGSLKYEQPGLFGLLPFISYGFSL